MVSYSLFWDDRFGESHRKTCNVTSFSALTATMEAAEIMSKENHPQKVSIVRREDNSENPNRSVVGFATNPHGMYVKFSETPQANEYELHAFDQMHRAQITILIERIAKSSNSIFANILTR